MLGICVKERIANIVSGIMTKACKHQELQVLLTQQDFSYFVN
jgi:hypothetical protein